MGLQLGVRLGLSCAPGSGGAAAWTPASLFASGEAGVWYDPSDLSTLWTDDGVTPVTADGDLVYRIDDKSGNGKHVLQATAANRPVYKTAGGLHWLDFDGVNDRMALAAAFVPNLAPPGIICPGFKFNASSATGQNLIAGDNGTGLWSTGENNGTFRFTALIDAIGPASDLNQNVAFVEINESSSTYRLNGGAPTTGNTGRRNYQGVTLGAFRNTDGAGKINGRIYQMVLRQGLLSSDDRDLLTEYTATKTGVTL